MADRGISPRVSGAVDLGSASKAWRKLYAGRIDEGTYIPGAFNTSQYFVSAGAGSFTAPVTGSYRITLQGGGGGGASAALETSRNRISSGGGGGQGGRYEFYANLIKNVSYQYIVGAGGSCGTVNSSTGAIISAATDGGNTSITIDSTEYKATGGAAGIALQIGGFAIGGDGGYSESPNYKVFSGAPGTPGSMGTGNLPGGSGGGPGGSNHSGTSGRHGGGGAGGYVSGAGDYSGGSNGGNGFIRFEYYAPTA